MYFVSVTTIEDNPVVKIERRNSTSAYFPLTEQGCLDAGKFMFNEKQENWQCSSSVDFPNEVDENFEGDVGELMREGYVSAFPPTVIFEKTVGNYEVRGNDFVAFAISSTDPEDCMQFSMSQSTPKTSDRFIQDCAFLQAVRWADKR